MNITIINQHANNWGDEAAGVALIEELLSYTKVDKIDIIYVGEGCLHYYNNKVNHNVNISLKSIGRKELAKRLIFSFFNINYRGFDILDKYLSIIERSDLIFVSPAGADIGRYKGWTSLMNLLLVRTCKKKVIFHLNTIGDSGSIIFNFLAKIVLKDSKLYVREKESYQYLKKLNLQCEFGIDTAYLLSKKVNPNVFCKKTIVFIPTALNVWNKEYSCKNIKQFVINNSFRAVCDYAKEKGYDIAILLHQLTEAEREFINELVEYAKFYNILGIHSYRNITSPCEYQDLIASASIVVSMRYHGVVLATKNYIPVLSLSYENKMEEVCNYMDICECNINILDATYDNTLKLIKYIQENEKILSIKMKKALNKKIYSAMKPVIENV